ncbi:MAG: four helix bundle protein [Nevskiales bacterium]
MRREAGGGRRKTRRHEQLDAWQDAMLVVEAIYRATASLPDSERFGLTIQLRRAAVSVASNIAEGAARQSTAEFLKFLAIARGSLSEVDTQIQIARRLQFLRSDDELDETLDRCFAKLGGLIRALKAKTGAV